MHPRFFDPYRPALALAVALAASVGLPQHPAQAQAQSQTAQGSYAIPSDFSAMVADKLSAVVGILSTGPAPGAATPPLPQPPPGMEDFFGAPVPDAPPPGPLRAQGSGFIISADGYVVTNNHVIADASRIEVILGDERQLDAELIGTDPATDIALIKIEADGTLPFVDWGSSNDLQIGEWLVAIGNPFGLGGTVTAGILSARSRDINAGPYDDFLQTDAAINSGNSGGPLFDAQGNVVGVNTAIFSPSGGSVGIGFAVPSQVAARIVDDLRDDGVVQRGWLGVQLQPLTHDLAAALGLPDATGALIATVTPDSPAAAAGLMPGEVITMVAGTPIGDARDLTFAVAELEIGTEVGFTVLRDGTAEQVSVTIGRQPGRDGTEAAEIDAGGTDTPRIGVAVVPVTAEVRGQLNLPQEVTGLAITGVAPQSPGARAGLRIGDVIVAAAGQTVASAEDLQSAVAQSASDAEPLLLRLFSRGTYSFRAVSVTDDPDG